LQSADFLHIFLKLHADFTDHTAVLLSHLSSEEGAFGAYCLARGWHGVAGRKGTLVRFGGWEQVKRKELEQELNYLIISIFKISKKKIWKNILG
jgi:hypothetical protein